MTNRNSIVLLAAICTLLFACTFENAASQGMIILPTRFPVQNEKTRIHLQTEAGNPIAGAHVTATYRPGSRVEKESEVGITDSGGGVDWTPEEAGIVAITAAFPNEEGNEVTVQTNVSVKFASTPLSGVLIMLFAGILLLGGSAVRFTRYIRGQGF